MGWSATFGAETALFNAKTRMTTVSRENLFAFFD